MTAQRERLAIHTGYKFYHNEYDHHSNHVLQLLTELYFELETFRELWAGKRPADAFVEDILRNMESIQQKFENDLRTDAAPIEVVDPLVGGGKGKGKANDHLEGEDATRYDTNIVSAASSHQQTSLPPLQSQRRRHSPAPLKLDLRKVPPRNLYKPLTIKLPATRRPESIESGAGDLNPSPRADISVFSPDVLPRTEGPGRPLGLTASQIAVGKEDPCNDALNPGTDKGWVRQQFRREYTVRGPITADTPRYETSPKHSPILPPRYPLRIRRKPSHSEPQNGGRNNATKQHGRKIKREDALIQDHDRPSLLSHKPQKRHDLPPVETGLDVNKMKMEPKGNSTTVVQTTRMNTRGKRHREDDAEQVKEGSLRSRKQPRRH